MLAAQQSDRLLELMYRRALHPMATASARQCADGSHRGAFAVHDFVFNLIDLDSWVSLAYRGDLERAPHCGQPSIAASAPPLANDVMRARTTDIF